MITAGEETKANELVIIRRHGGGEEAPHKGGVWKIAYADFMTAMMAFFLVMWLINATDQRVITQVATYFNPLKLTDKTAHPKGLHDSDALPQPADGALDHGKDKADAKTAKGTSDKSKGNKSENKKGGDAKAAEKSDSRGEAHYPEETLYRDPRGTLAKLAENVQHSETSTAQHGGESTGGGIAYRDPFDPAFRRPNREAGAEGHSEKALPAPVPAGAPGSTSEPEKPAAKAAPPSSPSSAQARAEHEAAAARAEASALDARIRQEIAQAAIAQIPNIDVKMTDEGMLVSLTDGYDFGMFAVASAEPRPAMVVVMEKIARILATRTEPLIVRGHTDGRPYRNSTYDNWRLSAARAHMAYLMLVRGGVEDARFERIEGYADHQLKVPSDREAAQNRRIEILLRRTKP